MWILSQIFQNSQIRKIARNALWFPSARKVASIVIQHSGVFGFLDIPVTGQTLSGVLPVAG